MRILSRYVFRQTAGALVLILLSLTGVVWIAVALQQLQLVTSQGQDTLRFLAITTLVIPSMMALIAPMGLLIAAIHVLNKLSSDSELIVMTAGGMPVWSLLKPFSLLALVVAVGVSGVNHFVGPWSQLKLSDLAVQVRTDLMSQIIQPWRFTSPETKLTVHIRDRAPDGLLLGLLMHDARNPKEIVTYLAEHARIIKQDGRAYLLMDTGHIVRKLEDQPTPQIIAFERYVVDANELEQQSHQTGNILRPRHRYTNELLIPDPNDIIFQTNPGTYASELHERFASPLHAFAFVLVVVAFMGQAQTTRSSRMQAAVGAFTVCVSSRVIGIVSANMLVVRPQAAPVLYAVPLATALAAGIAIQWHIYPRRSPKALVAVANLFDRMGASLLTLRRRQVAS